MDDSSGDGPARRVIEAAAFTGANSRAYLDALFAAYAEGKVVAVLPRGPAVRSIPGVKIVERRSFEDDPGWYEAAHAPITTDDPAQISFTSGTTGQPKPLLLAHRALADVTGRINAAMEVDEGISEYVGVPVTYSFGFGRVRAVAAAGGRAYLPGHGFDPAEIGRMLAAGDINAVSAVPTLWRVLLADPSAIGTTARRRLRWIEIGSQYMARSEKEALKRLFPEARIVQHYGLTEASRSTLLDISATEGDALESVGRPTGVVEIALSEEGLVRVRGPHLAEGIVSEAGVEPITDADGWLTTADRGTLRDGLLYFGGRADELINCGGIKVDPARFEQRLGERLGAREMVAVGRTDDALRGERILIATRRDAGIDRTALAEAATGIAAEHGLTGGALVYADLAEFPRTATGKIRRRVLADLAAETGVVPAGPVPPVTSGGMDARPDRDPAAEDPALARARELQAIWARVLGVETVALDQSFYDLGGDSLSALTVSLRMEGLGLAPETARGIFEGRTIAELAGVPADAVCRDRAEGESATVAPAAPPPPSAPETTAGTATPLPRVTTYVWSVNALRGLVALLVVFVHWGPGLVERAAGDAAGPILAALLPLFRFGTPGFAFVFGLGAGFFLLRNLATRPHILKQRGLTGLALVGSAMILLAATKLTAMALEGRPITGLTVANAFYGVLAFYLLAFLTLPLWVRALHRTGATATGILGAALGAWALSWAVKAVVPPAQIDGLLEWPKMMLIAKYNYFNLMAMVFAGVAAGVWLGGQDDPDRTAARLMTTGGW